VLMAAQPLLRLDFNPSMAVVAAKGDPFDTMSNHQGKCGSEMTNLCSFMVSIIANDALRKREGPPAW